MTSSGQVCLAGNSSLDAQLPSHVGLQYLTRQLQNVHSVLWLSTPENPYQSTISVCQQLSQMIGYLYPCNAMALSLFLYDWNSEYFGKRPAVVTGLYFWNTVSSLHFSKSWHTEYDSVVSTTMSHKQVLPTFSNTCHNKAAILRMLTWEQLPLSSVELTTKEIYVGLGGKIYAFMYSCATVVRSMHVSFWNEWKADLNGPSPYPLPFVLKKINRITNRKRCGSVQVSKPRFVVFFLSFVLK